jgi:hypothetical protein
MLLAYGDERAYGGNTGYQDDPERVYRYNNFVPNHHQLHAGDVVVLCGRALMCAVRQTGHR